MSETGSQVRGAQTGALRTILIIEDDHAIGELISRKFQHEQFSTAVKTNGSDGLEYLTSAEELPDCIVLDLVMPGMDGLQVLRRIQADPRLAGIPLVVVTGREADDIVTEAFDLGADDYVTKPFSPTALVARVRRLIR